MTTNLKFEQSELESVVKDNIYWFAPPEERNFITGGAVEAAALVLLGLFFSGIVEGVKEATKDEGKKFGKKAVEYLRDVVTGLLKPKNDEIETSANAATAKVSNMENSEVVKTFDYLETEFADGFAEVMPDQDALFLAQKVRFHAVRVIYFEMEYHE
jgi:hypothetical protein